MSDPCCAICRHSTGVCLSRRTCSHHLAAERAEDADDKARQTVRRPTEDQAIWNIERKTRGK